MEILGVKLGIEHVSGEKSTLPWPYQSPFEDGSSSHSAVPSQLEPKFLQFKIQFLFSSSLCWSGLSVSLFSRESVGSSGITNYWRDGGGTGFVFSHCGCGLFSPLPAAAWR